MDLSVILVIAMFAVFIALLFTGFPVAWVLGGTAVIFTVVGLVAVEFFGADLWFDWGSSMGLPFEAYGILITILLVVFLLGFVLDWVELTLIILPLVAPVVQGLGFDLLWFTVLFAVCLQTSFLTPPVGFAIFYIKGVCPPEIHVTDIYRGVAPYIGLQVLGLVIVFAWPGIVTWLPSVAYG